MSKKQNKISLVWFKNDLRINDNISLTTAIENSKKVIAVYIFDPKQFEVNQYGFKKTENYRAQFLIESIIDLKANLEALNISLLIYNETVTDIISKLNDTYNFEAIYYQNEWTKEEVEVIDNVKLALPEVKFNTDYDQFLFHPKDVPYELENIPRVFTEFRKKCENILK